MQFNPVHHTIIATDVARSGGRNDELIIRMRRDLRRMLADVLAEQGITMQVHPSGDLGDGFRVLLPSSISPVAALNPFVANLETALRLHRAASSDAHRIRLRVVVHSGLLHPDGDDSWAGTPLKECARLLEAPAGRRVLDAVEDADMVLIVSETIHDSVVRHGYAMDPALFERVPVDVKETREHAWAYVPRFPPGRGDGRESTPGPEPAGGLRHDDAEDAAGGATGPADRHRATTEGVALHGSRTSGVSIAGGQVTTNAPIVGGDFTSGPAGGGHVR